MNNSLLVIIVTYNGMKWLRQCLDSIKKSTISAELFIIDNGSTDCSVEFIKENYPEAKLIVSPENLGFGKANNIGFQYAIDNKFDYVYLLNQDAWVEPETFEKLINISKTNPEFGIISPMQANRELSKLDYNFVKCCPESLLSDLACDQTLKEIYPVEFVMAAHWLLPIDAVKKVGGFSPIFQHYGEDHNYIHRAKYHSYQIGIVPSTFAVHDRESRIDSIEKQQYLFYTSNLVVLSNITARKRLFRVINNYLQTIFGNIRIYNTKYLSKTLIELNNIYYIAKKSKAIGAFIRI